MATRTMTADEYKYEALLKKVGLGELGAPREHLMDPHFLDRCRHTRTANLRPKKRRRLKVAEEAYHLWTAERLWHDIL